MKKTKAATREYIITYRSHEHYEVLGWVKASSDREAVSLARIQLKAEIEKYAVRDATIAQWRASRNVEL